MYLRGGRTIEFSVRKVEGAERDWSLPQFLRKNKKYTCYGLKCFPLKGNKSHKR